MNSKFRTCALTVLGAIVATSWGMNAASAGPSVPIKTYVFPHTPQNLTAQEQQLPPSIALSWSKGGPFKDWVYRNPGPFNAVAIDGSTYTDSSAAPGVQYSYSVCEANNSNLCATVDARIRPDPKAPAWIRADRQSETYILLGWPTGDEGTDFFQVQSKFVSSASWGNLGGHLAASDGHYDVTIGGGGGGGGESFALNLQAFTNENLLYRVCAGNNVGTTVCTDGVHPQAATMQYAPFPVNPVPHPSPIPTP